MGLSERKFLTVGLGEFTKKNKALRERLSALNNKHGVFGKVIFEQGFPIPCGKRKNDVCRENLLFLGDAGGLVDPLTGGGIYYAVKSGVIASTLVLKAFESGNLKVLKLYKGLIDKIFGTEFFWAKVVGNIFFNAKGLNFYVIKKFLKLQVLLYLFLLERFLIKVQLLSSLNFYQKLL
ncbi:MAG: hypothetical protein ABGX27_04215 [Desulfurobacteriaceae bacterium]